MDLDEQWLDPEENVVDYVEEEPIALAEGETDVDVTYTNADEWRSEMYQEEEVDYTEEDTYYLANEDYNNTGEDHIETEPEVVADAPIELEDYSRNIVSYVEYLQPSTSGGRKVTIAQCEVCGVILKHPSKIEAHMRTHTGEKPFECSICGTKFSQKSPMLAHYRKHLGDTPFSCSICHKKFVNCSQKTAHELRHKGLKRKGPPRPHLKPAKRLMQVEIPVPSTSSLHITSHTSPGVEETTSTTEWKPQNTQLNATISAASSRKIDEVIEAVAAGHMLKESSPAIVQKKPAIQRAAIVAQCHICGLMLKYPSKIAAHMRTHSGEKPYQCSACGEKFVNRYSAEMHYKRKHSERGRNVPCTWECGKMFVSIGARNEHERIVHSGVRRYECTAPGCRQMFSRRIYLMQHRVKEHPKLYVPVYDPDEVLAAEQNEAGHIAHTDEYEVEDINGQVRLVKVGQGMVVVSEDVEQYPETFLEGHFVDDEEMFTPVKNELMIKNQKSEQNILETNPGDSNRNEDILESSAQDTLTEEDELKQIWVQVDKAGPSKVRQQVAVRILRKTK